jgi:HTH-type transcriptional regulator / antitoxin HipB
MLLTPEEIGRTVRTTRKEQGVTQADLALTSGTGLRFLIELEKGKPTCQIGKVLNVLQTLGIELALSSRPMTSPAKEQG